MLNMTIKDPITAHVNLLEAYDTTYGIYDHMAESADPMALFTMHPHEDTVTNNHLVSLMFRVMASRLPEYSNCSISELLLYPRSILMQLIKKAEGETKKSKVGMDALNQSLRGHVN